MLVLTRKVGESLIIGDNIKITICAVNNSQIRVGIQAPKDIEIHREEIYEKIKKEKKVSDNNKKDSLLFESLG